MCAVGSGRGFFFTVDEPILDWGDCAPSYREGLESTFVLRAARSIGHRKGHSREALVAYY